MSTTNNLKMQLNDEAQPRRIARVLWGPILVFLIITLVAFSLVWLKGELFQISTPEQKKMASIWILVAFAGMLIVHILVFSIGAYQIAAWIFRKEASVDGTLSPVPTLHDPLASLRETLRMEHRWTWRYRRPWLLLAGDASTATRLLPELTQKGYLRTESAILFWPPQVSDGQPDPAWLKHIYVMRRRRPIDGICLLRDGAQEVSSVGQGLNPSSLRMERIAQILRWSAPIYVINMVRAGMARDGASVVSGCEFSAKDDAGKIESALLVLRDQLAARGVRRVANRRGDDSLAGLSQYLDLRAAPLANWLESLNRQRMRGVFFAAVPNSVGAAQVELASADFSVAPLWRHLSKLVRRDRGRRTVWHPTAVGTAIVVVSAGLWIAGMLVSSTVNQRDLASLQQVVRHVGMAHDMTARLRGLLVLQQEIARYEYRVAERAPWYTRFGLNRDGTVLQALWRPYQNASQAMLIAPVQQTLETELIDLAQTRSDRIDAQASRFATDGHQSLKAYLMLSEPRRSEADFLAPQLARRWHLDARLGSNEQSDLGQRLFAFYAAHLAAHPEWRLQASANLVAAARATLLTAIGVERADTTLYRQILAGAADKYPDQNLSLLTLGTDPRGLLRSNAIVPGMFTRQAYEGIIAPAIAEAAKRAVIASDWVLAATSSQPSAGLAPDRANMHTPQELQHALTARYFEEYAEQWQIFMNSLQWESVATMPAAAEQLKWLADARQSPVIALMKSLHYQANAGQRQVSLSDTLVTKARDLIGGKKSGPDSIKAEASGPLGETFGPVLRLIGNIDGAGQNDINKMQANSELSLQRYLDRVSALRLRLQQINGSPDGEMQARHLALSLFQGKGSDLVETQAYAQLVAASLGEQWAGMGDALFVKPVMQATQALLQPAQTSLNEAWSNNVASTWQRAFSGRYPFASTDNDASLPELARFLRPQGGLIPGFLQGQLAGVLELQGDRWVPVAGSKLNFDPAFLLAINTLQRIGTQLLVQGEPQYRFDLKPLAQAPMRDVMLRIDGQKLSYNNGQESWKNLVWPAPVAQDAGTRLQWETEQAGIRKHYEFGGRWAWIRMLERARIEPLDGATYQLTWQGVPDPANVAYALNTDKGTAAERANPVADSEHMLPRAPMASMSSSLTHPLSYLMRTEAGRGPLEILALRDFVLPARIFMTADRGNGAVSGALKR